MDVVGERAEAHAVTELKGHVENYVTGRLATYVRERRAVGGAAQMIEASQPPGDMSDPPTSDLALGFSLTGGIRSVADLGAGRFRRVSPVGDFYVTPPRVASTILVDDPHVIRVMGIPTGTSLALEVEQALGGPTLDGLAPLSRLPFQDDVLLGLTDWLWERGGADNGASSLTADAVVAAIWHRLAHLAARSRPPSTRGGLASWQERRCVEYLQDNLAEDVDLATLAGVAQLSPFHFARMFKKTTGAPPHRYQLLLRLERAKKLLVETEMSVLQIALAVGYESPQTLARLFRRELGLTPSAYRRERKR